MMDPTQRARGLALAALGLSALLALPARSEAGDREDGPSGDASRTTGLIDPLSKAADAWTGWRRVGPVGDAEENAPSSLAGSEADVEDDLDLYDEDFDAEREARRLRSRRDGRRDLEEIRRFRGDVLVREDERVDGDVVTFWGDVVVLGKVTGDVVAVFGDVDVAPTGRVTGDCVSVSGTVRQAPGSHVDGEVAETSWRGLYVKDGSPRRKVDGKHLRVVSEDGVWDVTVDDDDVYAWSHDDVKCWNGFDFDGMSSRHGQLDARRFFDPIRYNRVDGLFLGAGFDSRERGGSGVELYATGGYGFQSGAWQGQVGLQRSGFRPTRRFTLGVRAYDYHDTEDRWRISSGENSGAALVFHHDFYDFYRRKGLTAHASQRLGRPLLVQAEYVSERQDDPRGLDATTPLGDRVNTEWSIFRGGAHFRGNPAVDAGDLRAAALALSWDTRNRPSLPRRGWLGVARFERAGTDGLGGDFRYDRAVADLRRYQRLGRYDALDVRVRAGSISGTAVPSQALFDLGGVGSLRGYDYKAFQNADRMLLANVEYEFGDFDEDWVDGGMLEDMTFAVFLDTGKAWNAPGGRASDLTSGFGVVTAKSMKSDVGFGLGLGDDGGDARIDFARPLGEHDAPILVTVRLEKSF